MYTNMELWSEVRRRVLTGELSKRQACQKYQLHWDTLAKILRHEEPPGYRKKQARPKPVLGPFVELIHEILEADKRAPKKQRHTAKRILERLREQGYRGGRTVVQEEVRRQPQQIRKAKQYSPLSQVLIGIASAQVGPLNGDTKERPIRALKKDPLIFLRGPSVQEDEPFSP